MKVNKKNIEFLKRFRCIEEPSLLYESNKELFDKLYGSYDNYLSIISKEYMSRDDDEF